MAGPPGASFAVPSASLVPATRVFLAEARHAGEKVPASPTVMPSPSTRIMIQSKPHLENGTARRRRLKRPKSVYRPSVRCPGPVPPRSAQAIGASPSGKAVDFDSTMRRFESSRPSQSLASKIRHFSSCRILHSERWLQAFSERLFPVRSPEHVHSASSWPTKRGTIAFRVAFIRLLRSVGGKRSALVIGQLRFFQLSHSAMTAGVQSKRRGQSQFLPHALDNILHAQEGKWLELVFINLAQNHRCAALV
jgi:hypothetical protein